MFVYVLVSLLKMWCVGNTFRGVLSAVQNKHLHRVYLITSRGILLHSYRFSVTIT